MNFWPFKKKIKISVVETDTYKQKIAGLEEALAKKEKEAKDLKERNMPIIAEAVKKVIAEVVEQYKKDVPQPFVIGDMVMPLMKYTRNLGWLGTGNTFVNTFIDTHIGISHSMKMPVYKVWVDTGWLNEVLDPNWSRHSAIQDLYTVKNPDDIERIIRSTVQHLKEIKIKDNLHLVEWTVDFDWAQLNFMSRTKDAYLNLRWGGLVANSFIKADSDIAKAQVKYVEASEIFSKAKKEYEAIKEEFDSIKITH